MKIIIDDREDGNIISHFKYAAQRVKSNDIEIEVEQLLAGDIIYGNAAIEHKAPADFISSYQSGRLFKQIEQMQRNFENCMIAIDGTPDEIMKVNTNQGAVISCFVRGAPVLFCGDTYTMADACIKYLIKCNDGKIRDHNPNVNQKIHKDPQLNIITGATGISEDLGEKLLTKFKSIENIVNAPISELKKVDKFGDKRAQKLYQELHTVRW